MKYDSRAMCSFFWIWIWTSNEIDLINSMFLKYLQLCHCNFQKKKFCFMAAHVSTPWRTRQPRCGSHAGQLRVPHELRAPRKPCALAGHVDVARHHVVHPDRANACFKKRALAIYSKMHALTFFLWYLLCLNSDFELVSGVGKLSMSSLRLCKN